MSIPKNIMTVWLTFDNGPLPPLIKRCIESQKLPGYTQKVITLENCYKGSKYVNKALEKAKALHDAGKPITGPWDNPLTWIVKASDWLRCYHICEEGGIYLDADMEVIPGKNFDDLLDCRFFTEIEAFGMPANSAFGSEAGHPFLKEYLPRIEENFCGDGIMVFEPGARAFADLMWIYDKAKNGIKIFDTSMFFPYTHGKEIIKVTPQTKVYHHYVNSWCDDRCKKKLGTEYETKDFTEIFKGKI